MPEEFRLAEGPRPLAPRRGDERHGTTVHGHCDLDALCNAAEHLRRVITQVPAGHHRHVRNCSSIATVSDGSSGEVPLASNAVVTFGGCGA